MTLVQTELDLYDSPLTGKVKGERSIMEFPFFHLSKGRRMQPIVYVDHRVAIEVKPSSVGVATIYDKEILLYIASLMVEKMNKGEQPEQDFVFTGHDFLRVVGANRSARSYERLTKALERLQGTQIKTNIEAGGEGEDGFFSWVSEARVQYTKARTGEKRLKAIKVRLCDWLYRAILKDLRILTYDHRYFTLSPIERRLYEVARSHCGNQACFVIGLEKLRRRVGCEDTLAKFNASLRKVEETESLPEYSLTIVRNPASPTMRALRAEGLVSPLPGRSLQGVLVKFHPKGAAPTRKSHWEVEAA